MNTNSTVKHNSERLIWLDMLKGYGIIAIVLGHIQVGSLGMLLYSFHVPLFFFASGYVFNTRDNFRQLLRKKIKSLLVPYLCLGLILIIFDMTYRCFTTGLTQAEGFRIVASFLIQRRAYTLWFLTALFFSYIIFYFLFKYLKKSVFMLVASVLIAIAGLLLVRNVVQNLPYNIDASLTMMPFFCLGFLCRKYCKKIEVILNHFYFSAFLMLLLGVGDVLCTMFTRVISGTALDVFVSSYGYPPLTYIAAVCGIGMMLIISHIASFKPVLYFGQNSLLYFGLHQTIMIPLVEDFLNLAGLDNPTGDVAIFIYKFLEFIIIMTIITIINMFISRAKFKFIIGK